MPAKKKTAEPDLVIPAIPETETPTEKVVKTRKPVDKKANELKFLKTQLAEQVENVEQCRATIDAVNQENDRLRKELGRLSRESEIKGTVIANAVSTLANLHQSILLATRKEG